MRIGVKFLRLLGVIVLNCLIFGTTHATVIFDNTINPSGTVFGPGCCQVGDEITLGSNERKIIQLSWLVDSQNTDVVVDIETQIYANDGPGGAPGTLLWQSGPLTGINVAANDTFLDITVPKISVPDIISVTSIILDSTPVALGRIRGGAPSVGSVNASWFESSPGMWNQQFGPWGLQVSAVPEPSTFALLISASILLIVFSRRRATLE